MQRITPDHSKKFINCPRCRSFITAEFGFCQNCSLKVNENKVYELFEVEESIFRAASDAETLKWLSFFCFYYSITSVFFYLMGSFVWFNIGLWVASVYFTYSFIRWQLNYGSIKVLNQDFLEALKSRKNALVIFMFSLILGFATDFLMIY